MEGFFFSKSTGLYVARNPLRIDARVARAAAECGIKLNWDDEGRINYISHQQGLNLLKQLGAEMMSIKDYWLVCQDATAAGDEEMAKELQSDKYAEWLDTTIEQKEYLINHGKKIAVQMPFGHPGWFNPDDTDFKTGLPKKVELNREKNSTSWKYWSFCDYKYVAAAIRGWVTSVGKPSLDLGIPANAMYPVLLLRECRKALPRSPVDPEILRGINELVAGYNKMRNSDFYSRRNSFLEFISKHGKKFREGQEIEIYKIRERIGEILGILRLLAKKNHDGETFEKVTQTARMFWQVERPEIDFNDFVSFVRSSRERLERAVFNFDPIIFVVGHNNPDTDTVVSSLAEAYRNNLVDSKEVFIPVVQSNRIPDEVERLLGKKLSQSILLTSDPLYQKAKISGRARWIMVDHNKNSEIQKFAVSIIDHHIPSEIALRQNVSKTLEMVGSTTALVAQRINGLGVDVPPRLAHILYGATLMDTENRSELKMTSKDVLIMDDLKRIEGIESDNELYCDLMNFLLNTNDTSLLFGKDYKEDWGFFGFAVAKVKRTFDENGEVLKKEMLSKLVELAEQNNAEKNLSLTIVKVVDYEDDNETVNRERLYFVFDERTVPEFKKTMFDLVLTIVKHTFKGKAFIKMGADFLEFWGIGKQLSRKKTAPLIEPVVAAFNAYFYSPTTQLYVRREFLKATGRVKEAAKKRGVALSWDEKERVNNITYGESIRLLEVLGFTAMSLKEYWDIRRDAEAKKDQQMLASLQSGDFVEFLHTVIENGESVIEKPQIQSEKSGFQYGGIQVATDYTWRGEKQDISISAGLPGLIRPADIDPSTGLPAVVLPANIYNNPSLWRYWSPDAEWNVATRGHIFLLGQSALDLKVHLSEAFHCLGIRQCCLKVELPKVKISANEKEISIQIEMEGEVMEVREGDFLEITQ